MLLNELDEKTLEFVRGNLYCILKTLTDNQPTIERTINRRFMEDLIFKFEQVQITVTLEKEKKINHPLTIGG
jgi:hypothetical protein